MQKQHGDHKHHKSGVSHQEGKVGPKSNNHSDGHHQRSGNSTVTHHKPKKTWVAQRPQPVKRQSQQQLRTHTRSQVNSNDSAERRSTNRRSKNGRQNARSQGAKYTTRSTNHGGRD